MEVRRDWNKSRDQHVPQADQPTSAGSMFNLRMRPRLFLLFLPHVFYIM